MPPSLAFLTFYLLLLSSVICCLFSVMLSGTSSPRSVHWNMILSLPKAMSFMNIIIHLLDNKSEEELLTEDTYWISTQNSRSEGTNLTRSPDTLSVLHCEPLNSYDPCWLQRSSNPRVSSDSTLAFTRYSASLADKTHEMENSTASLWKQRILVSSYSTLSSVNCFFSAPAEEPFRRCLPCCSRSSPVVEDEVPYFLHLSQRDLMTRLMNLLMFGIHHCFLHCASTTQKTKLRNPRWQLYSTGGAAPISNLYGSQTSQGTTKLGQILSLTLGLLGLLFAIDILWPWIRIIRALKDLGPNLISQAYRLYVHLIRLLRLDITSSLSIIQYTSISERFYLLFGERISPLADHESCNASRVIYCNVSSKVRGRSHSSPLSFVFIERLSPSSHDSCSVSCIGIPLQHSSEARERSFPSPVLFVERSCRTLVSFLDSYSSLLHSPMENRLERSAVKALRAISELTSFTILLMDDVFRSLSLCYS